MTLLMYYKRNTVNGDLKLYYQVSMNTDCEEETIRQKHHFASFHTRCVDNDICEFEQKLADKQVQYGLIIPNLFFSESK